MLNGKHDPTPDGGSINDLFTFLDSFQNVFSSFFRRDRKRSWTLRSFEHFCLQESGLDGQHIDTVSCEPVTQGFKVGCQPCLGGIVTSVANPSTITGNGPYSN